jgi:hypothetical protein
MVMSGKMVGRGVDTLLVNVYYTDAEGRPAKRDLSPWLVEQLNQWKNRAIAEECPVVVPWVFGGAHLKMHPYGAGRGQWTWLLTSDLLTLCISRGRLNCIAMVRFSSEYLWSCRTLGEALQQVYHFLCDLFGTAVYLQVSEIHLCVDVAGWDVDNLDYRRDFVSRSRKRSGYDEPDWRVETHSYGLQRTGLTFSKHGPMSCAIYDKTREIKQQSGKLWFEDLWAANGWDHETTVWRVEFRFKRETLHELRVENLFSGIENAFDLPERLADLWVYAAGHVEGGADGLPDGWLRLVTSLMEDTNRSRWPTHPLWVAVQRAFVVEVDRPTDFHEVIRKRWEQWNTDKAIEATMGYATSLAAHVGGNLAKPETDFSVFLHWLFQAGNDYLEIVNRSFALEVQRKRIAFGLQTGEA